MSSPLLVNAPQFGNEEPSRLSCLSQAKHQLTKSMRMLVERTLDPLPR
jgi:hypothetical protein